MADRPKCSVCGTNDAVEGQRTCGPCENAASRILEDLRRKKEEEDDD